MLIPLPFLGKRESSPRQNWEDYTMPKTASTGICADIFVTALIIVSPLCRGDFSENSSGGGLLHGRYLYGRIFGRLLAGQSVKSGVAKSTWELILYSNKISETIRIVGQIGNLPYVWAVPVFGCCVVQPIDPNPPQ
jgi:hypothetical protein